MATPIQRGHAGHATDPERQEAGEGDEPLDDVAHGDGFRVLRMGSARSSSVVPPVNAR